METIGLSKFSNTKIKFTVASNLTHYHHFGREYNNLIGRIIEFVADKESAPNPFTVLLPCEDYLSVSFVAPNVGQETIVRLQLGKHCFVSFVTWSIIAPVQESETSAETQYYSGNVDQEINNLNLIQIRNLVVHSIGVSIESEEKMHMLVFRGSCFKDIFKDHCCCNGQLQIFIFRFFCCISKTQ